MANHTLRNVPLDLSCRLHNLAEAHQRSLSEEVIAILESTAKEERQPSVIADLKPYADYKDTGLPWLGQVPAQGQFELTP